MKSIIFITAVLLGAVVSCQSEKDPEPSLCDDASFESHIEPILMVNCAISGCHDGSNGAERDWTSFSNVKNKASRIKEKTQSGSMPPGDRSISQEQIDLIACWVDNGASEN